MTPWKDALERAAKAITDSYSAGEFGTVLSAQRVIESLSQAGYVVAPREPTGDMAARVEDYEIERPCYMNGSNCTQMLRGDEACDIYTAMIQAWEKERDTK